MEINRHVARAFVVAGVLAAGLSGGVAAAAADDAVQVEGVTISVLDSEDYMPPEEP